MGSGATMKMIVEGPYGGPCLTMYASFTSAFVIVGGSGITYGLSVVEELIRDIENLQARTRMIQFLWVVQDPTCILPLLPELASLLNRVSYIPTVTLKLCIHYTRAVSPSFASRLKVMKGLPKNVTLEAGRPNVQNILGTFVQKTDGMSRGKGGLTGIAVAVCGPKGLAEDVRNAAAAISTDARKSVGGVEVVEETFGW